MSSKTYESPMWTPTILTAIEPGAHGLQVKNVLQLFAYECKNISLSELIGIHRNIDDNNFPCYYISCSSTGRDDLQSSYSNRIVSFVISVRLVYVHTCWLSVYCRLFISIYGVHVKLIDVMPYSYLPYLT